jgi:hypothetical protein
MADVRMKVARKKVELCARGQKKRMCYYYAASAFGYVATLLTQEMIHAKIQHQYVHPTTTTPIRNTISYCDTPINKIRYCDTPINTISYCNTPITQ